MTWSHSLRPNFDKKNYIDDDDADDINEHFHRRKKIAGSTVEANKLIGRYLALL